MNTENLLTLKINKLTQEQYDREKELIEYIAGEHVKSGVDYVKNYFVGGEKIIIPVKPGEKITHNLWGFWSFILLRRKRNHKCWLFGVKTKHYGRC